MSKTKKGEFEMKRTKLKMGLFLMLMITALNAFGAKQFVVEKVSNPNSNIVEITPNEDRDYFFWI